MHIFNLYVANTPYILLIAWSSNKRDSALITPTKRKQSYAQRTDHYVSF